MYTPSNIPNQNSNKYTTTDNVLVAILNLLNGTPAGSGANQAGIKVAGDLISRIVTFARPANVTPYNANDAVNNGFALEFTNAGAIQEGTGYITKALLRTNVAANTQQMRLHLFKNDPAPIPADNDPYLLEWFWADFYIGFIDFPPLSTEGAGSDSAGAMLDGIRLAYNCEVGQTSIYGVLETKSAFTPTSGQEFKIELLFDRN